MLFNYQSQQQAAQHHSQTGQHNHAVQANHLIGQQVRINRGGPDSVLGVLIAIPGNFLVVLSENVIVYVNGTHVKSITEGGNDGGKSGGNSSGNRTRGSAHRSFISAPNFQSLLNRLRHKHIQINRGGPEKLDGFLAEISKDNVLLIVDRELVRIPVFHIKNVSLSGKNQNNKNDNKNDNKNNNKSGNNKSGNNKSGNNKSGNNKSGNNKSGNNKSNNKKSSSGNKNKSGQGGERNRSKGNARR
ncbi:hypothetical protein [Cohnella abietis]|uniref:Spore coat protein B n=1 Tax=Cohnella abietis TaxID=2507935 RepID=A0A3T1D3I6_9BACL|nr:hypothetical protein [Cohnella abietis]BBI32579.1 hypothetical protein KCTCHS21_19780 [Cohnella abietis]